MRALLPILLVAMTARGACVHPLEIPVGPRTVQPLCNYWKADVAASGSHAAGAWMRSTTGISGTVGSTQGGILDARGRLASAEQLPMNSSPGYPSIATNGQLSLLAWSHTQYGTFAQFLDANGARIGAPIEITKTGMSYTPPRALWTGSEWRVVYQEDAYVGSARVEPDGSIPARKVVAANATLVDAHGGSVVVSGSVGFVLITPSIERVLPIPSGAKVAIGDRFVAWAADGGVSALRLPDGTAIPIDVATGVDTIATAGDVVLWSDWTTTRGARVNDDGSRRILDPFAGRLHAAAATNEGVVVLISSTCASVASRFLPNGAIAFEDAGAASRAMVAQAPHALVATPRGHQVVWSEPRPAESGSRLYVTSFEGNAPRPPVELGLSSSAGAAPFGEGSAIAFAEYATGNAPATLKLARVDGDGQLREAPRTIAATWFIFEIAVAVEGETIHVFTLEHASYAWIGNVWRTSIAPDGTIAREQIAANVDGWNLDAARTPEGIVTSWYDAAGVDILRLTVREPDATRTSIFAGQLPAPSLFGGTTPLVLWRGSDGVHALFPRTSVDVIVGPSGAYGGTLKEALQQPDGSFAVATAPNDLDETHLTIVNLTPTGVVTPREEVCFDRHAWLLSMRGPTFDALVTSEGGAVFLAKRPLPRRRAVR